MVPDLPSGKVPPVPDVNTFEVSTGMNCAGNDKAISVDIVQGAGNSLEITICTFLQFDLEGELDAGGLLDSIEDYLSLTLNAGYVLKGALSTGVKIKFASLTAAPEIELDPITTQLYAQSEVTGTLGLGLIEATMTGSAKLEGNLGLAYCTSCNGVLEGFERAGENSSFYFSRAIGFQLGGELALSAGGVPGVEIGVGAKVMIEDDDGKSFVLA